MTSSNTGLVKNMASILESENDNGLRDINTANDRSSADLIITISTGETIRLILIPIAISTLLAIGSYIIIKNVQR